LPGRLAGWVPRGSSFWVRFLEIQQICVRAWWRREGLPEVGLNTGRLWFSLSQRAMDNEASVAILSGLLWQTL
ncbi:MAG: hypothetical protein KJ070_26075, partial [Verrucomicrobia bacterium]|nr:hypothetical protein [Verrucomicrobiota bacterium]